MSFPMFPFAMIAFCAVLVVLMMRGMAHADVGHARARAGPSGTLSAPRNGVPAPVWFVLAALALVLWWPLGLMILAFIIWSRTMGCCGLNFGPWNVRAAELPNARWFNQQPTTGNRSFDEYRADTLRRLEQEERDFHDFLGRLRMAKDKAEFDQFMTERRSPQEHAG
jgi:uncharacterized protein DUF2852